jgi:flagellum-specific peptidoglycan hydrolase FlgJ
MNLTQQEWIVSTAEAAKAAEHIWPMMAACEAALESAFGTSALAREGLNLFGMKVHIHEQYGVLSLPTREFEQGSWVTLNAEWVKYPTLADCFEDRMETLRRLAHAYPHYAAALAAADQETYVREVSQTWSTDPQRADKVLSIYKQATDSDSVWPGG